MGIEKSKKTNKMVTQVIDNILNLENFLKDVILVLLERSVINKGKLWFGIIE